MEQPTSHSSLEISVLVVEDEILTQTLVSKLLSAAGLRVVGAVSNASEAMSLSRRFKPDVAMLDINLGGGPTGLDIAAALRKSAPHIGLVFLSSVTDIRTLSPNQPPMPEASIYLNKSDISKTDQLITAIQSAFQIAHSKISGEFATTPLISEPYTDLQLELMRLISLGKSNAAIAALKFTTVKSTENAISRLAKKMNIPNDEASNQRVLIAREFFRLNSKVHNDE